MQAQMVIYGDLAWETRGVYGYIIFWGQSWMQLEYRIIFYDSLRVELHSMFWHSIILGTVSSMATALEIFRQILSQYLKFLITFRTFLHMNQSVCLCLCLCFLFLLKKKARRSSNSHTSKARAKNFRVPQKGRWGSAQHRHRPFFFLLPLDADAITWYRFRQKYHSNHHITCQQTVPTTLPKQSSNTKNTPLTARRTRPYRTNNFGLLIHISNTSFHHNLRWIRDMAIHHPSMTTPIAHAFSLSPRIYRHFPKIAADTGMTSAATHERVQQLSLITVIRESSPDSIITNSPKKY